MEGSGYYANVGIPLSSGVFSRVLLILLAYYQVCSIYVQIAIIKPSTMPEFPIRKAKWMLIRSDFSSTAKWVLYTTGQSYNHAGAGVT